MKPLLALETDTLDFKKSMIFQPKINGIRATWDSKKNMFSTRNGNYILSVDHIMQELKDKELNHIDWDGEIFTWNLSFQVLNGMVRRQYSDERSRILEYHIFDIADRKLKTKDRLTKIVKHIPNNSFKYLKRVPSVVLSSEYSANLFYKDMLKDGYEGVIIRELDTPYSEGKKVSNGIWKYKPVYDLEATLIGLKDSTSELNKDTFACLILRMDNDKIVECSGMTQKDRKEIKKEWKNNKKVRVTIEYGTLSDDGIPIFPRYRGIRWDCGKGD